MEITDVCKRNENTTAIFCPIAIRNIRKDRLPLRAIEKPIFCPWVYPSVTRWLYYLFNIWRFKAMKI